LSDGKGEPMPETPSSHVSPLKNVIIEFHEVYKELADVGFSEQTSARIIANMLIDVVFYRGTGDDTDIELDYEDDEEGEDDDDDGADGDAGVG